MAVKNKTNDEISKIKKALEEKRLIIGTERVLKSLKLSRLVEVFITSNSIPEVKDQINHFANLQKVTVTSLSMDNEELGVICKKPFSVNVVGISA
ncbi:ribosomal L7Ae/L30e/S12e/Gadd45 family protein [Candidatus Woesearchaeota archaeon]|nr:ribosomal L7Ae/L30e/S12e/Gadd45 family protein [Candidatus Woesearchaeota archaeon]